LTLTFEKSKREFGMVKRGAWLIWSWVGRGRK